MESNNQEQLKEEEIPNIEQFQVDRRPSPEEEAHQNAGGGSAGIQNATNPDAGYTEQEVQFADGEGSPLNDELLGPEDDEDDEEDEDDIIVDDPDDDEINVDDPDEEDLV